ncbi:MAG TPA: DUF2064 domain-containing protein [Nocardioidaceae bacterium]|nr:DUF2064 domain-containing protein [Nocardioidaceae bacterium]
MTTGAVTAHDHLTASVDCLTPPVVLVVAKAPVPGRVKTRLAASEGAEGAARLALAALLDTLEVCELVFGVHRCHLALDGDLEQVTGIDLEARLDGWTLHRQRGEELGERIANAHRDVHLAAGAPVVQLGMDTPHVSAAVLAGVADRVTRTRRPVLGLAADGGWWVLATGTADDVHGLEAVPMSTPETGRATLALLHRTAGDVADAPVIRDVDEVSDAEDAAALAPQTRFARAWRTRGAR